jgi:SpoIID/LytB domain protein
VLEPSGPWDAFVANSCTAAAQAKTTATPLATGLVNPTVSPSTSAAGTPALLTLCRHDGVDEPLQGNVQALDHAGYERTLNLLPMQSYLDGVVPAEESASWGDDGGQVGAPQGQDWGFQALEAQAIAARSYALAYAAAGGWQGYANICDDTYCQAYVGSSYATAVSNLAVTDTAGAVLVAGGVTVVTARYSASTGGWTDSSTFPAVRDRGDSCVVPGNALECNPSHSWAVTISGSAIVRQFRSVGRLLRVRVIARNGRGAFGGRVLEVSIIGKAGSVTVTGNAFAAALNLRSNWFAISSIRRE